MPIYDKDDLIDDEYTRSGIFEVDKIAQEKQTKKKLLNELLCYPITKDEFLERKNSRDFMMFLNYVCAQNSDLPYIDQGISENKQYIKKLCDNYNLYGLYGLIDNIVFNSNADPENELNDSYDKGMTAYVNQLVFIERLKKYFEQLNIKIPDF